MWSSLAASLAIHGIALGGLVLSAGPRSPEPSGGERTPGGAGSGAAVMVRLLGESAAPDQAGASADFLLPQIRTSRVQPQPPRTAEAPRRTAPRQPPDEPAPVVLVASDKKPPPPAPRPPAAPSRSEDLIEVASAPTSPPQTLTRPAAGAGSSASQTASGIPSRAFGPAGGPLPSAAPGPGRGQGAGRFDRVARPVGSIRPHYPPRARQRGEEADVTVDVWVGALGDVDRAAVSRSAGPEFDAAALAAVEQARFHPALRDGEPVASRVALRLHFRLEQ